MARLCNDDFFLNIPGENNWILNQESLLYETTYTGSDAEMHINHFRPNIVGNDVEMIATGNCRNEILTQQKW